MGSTRSITPGPMHCSVSGPPDRFFAQQAQELSLPVTKELPNPEPAPECVYRTAEAGSRPFVVHHISHPGTICIATAFGMHQVTVPPITEGPGDLHIAEMMISLIVVNEGEPAQSDRRKWHWTEAHQNT